MRQWFFSPLHGNLKTCITSCIVSFLLNVLTRSVEIVGFSNFSMEVWYGIFKFAKFVQYLERNLQLFNLNCSWARVSAVRRDL